MDNDLDTTNYFTITPMSQRFDSLEPGQTYTGSISVINPVSAEGDFNYSAYVAPYGVIGTDYSADLLNKADYNQIVDWITIDEPTGSVSPNDTKKVNFTITVPTDAPAGGQYAAIVVSQDYSKDNTKNNGLAVNNILEIASLIYTDVAGETIHAGEILENNIPSFVTEPSISLSTTLTNDGNVHESAIVMIEATDFFTKDIIVEAETQDDYYNELIMPHSTRYVERDINENLPALGIVHVEQTIYYNDHSSKEVRDVIICPVWFMLIVLTALGFLIFIIIHKIKQHHKRRKKKSSTKSSKSTASQE